MSSTAVQMAMAKVELQRRQAKTDANDFIEYSLQDEEGEPLQQALFHEEWQNILTSQKRACIQAPVEHGKTVQISVARPLYEIGKDTGIRILLIMASATQARKRLGAIKNNIETNPKVQEVFPELTKDKFDIWALSHINYRQTRASTRHDYTMQAVGVGGDFLGSRVDLAILDDVLTFLNTSTHEQRKKIIDWFETTLIGRITKNGRIWVLGTPWHPKDLLHYLKDLEDFSSYRYAATPNDEPIWPAQWTKERLAERRRILTPYRYAQQFDCMAVDDETQRFDEDWFIRCALQGKGLTFPAKKGYDGDVVTGLDLGISRKKKSHETAFFTLGFDPTIMKRRPLYIASGRWRKKEIVNRAKRIHARFGGIFMVENNQAQDYLVQELAEDTEIPVVPYTTTRGKKLHPDFGIESIGVELENRKWLLPADPTGKMPEYLEEWKDQCMDFRPTEHPGDILMASFFALEGIRRYEGDEGGGIEVG